MKATIYDVAREAGVSISTVSKALNNSYTISGETTIHIKEIAERLNYRPNARAQTLARQMNKDVTLLTPSYHNMAFINPHMVEAMIGAENALSTKGYALKLQGCNRENVYDFASIIIDSKNTDGLMIHGALVTRELAILITSREIPHIILGSPNFRNSLCWIDINNRYAGEIAANHLVETGRRKIAFIGGTDDDNVSKERFEGVKNKLKDQELVFDEEMILKGTSTAEDGSRMAGELINRGMPDSIVCANNVLAFGCMRFLQASNIRIPDDISIITFDDYPLAQLTIPMLTTVSIDVYDMGWQAAKLIIDKIKKPQMLIQTYATMPRLVIRGSTMKT